MGNAPKTTVNFNPISKPKRVEKLRKSVPNAEVPLMTGILRNQVRKTVLPLFVLSLFIVALVGCRQDPEIDAAADTSTEITGEIYDSGSLRTFVPDGWAAFPEPDVFAAEPDAVKSSCFHVIMGGTDYGDLHSKPYVSLELCGPDEQPTALDPEFNKDIESVGPLELGNRIWSGYVFYDCFGGYGKNVIGKMAILWSESDDVCFRAVLRLEFNGQEEKITMEDRDVQAILSHVELSQQPPISQKDET